MRLHALLRPGGTLLFTDYCRDGRADAELSPAFRAYVQEKGYTLLEPSGYLALAQAAGFTAVQAEDSSEVWSACH